MEIGDDVLDVRDLIARVEELEEEGTDIGEIGLLMTVLDELQGYGGDEQWRGYWYPLTLIRDSYFEDYARELAEDIGAINRDATWPNNCIDWEEAASQLKQDYSSIDIDGTTYWHRS